MSPLAWAAAYVVLRTVWGVTLAIATERTFGRPAFVWASTAADACSGALVMAWWHPAVRPVFGAWVLPMFLYLLAFETIAAVLRFRPLEDAVDAEFSHTSLLAAPALVAWELGGVVPPLLAGAALSFMV